MKIHIQFPASLALALALLPAIAFADDDWLPVSPEDRRLTSEQAGGANAIILYHEHSSDDSSNSRFEYYRVKILTEKGKSYASVNIYYGGPQDVIQEIKARTIAPDGAVIPFSGQILEREVTKSRGLRLRAKTLILPGVAVGSIIEWRYKVYGRDYDAHPASWILQEDLVQKRARFTYVPHVPSVTYYTAAGRRGAGNAQIATRGTVPAPARQGVRLTSLPSSAVGAIQTEHSPVDGVFFLKIGLPEKAEIKRGINDRMDLELTDIPAYVEEELSPPADAIKMRVLFYYGGRNMMKPDDFWKEEGTYWSRSVDKFIGRSAGVSQAAQGAVQPADTAVQKAARVYAFVQGLQNQSYSREIAGAERKNENLKPNTSAESVLERRSGTRTELTRLFIAMMRALDMPAFAMRVAPRNLVLFDPKVPDWRQLESEIAIADLGNGKEIFLDPGTPGCPFGVLEWSRTAVMGQRQSASGSAEFLGTPEPRYSQALTQRVARLKLEDSGTLTGKIVVVYNGQEALQHRLHGLQTDAAGRNQQLEDDLKAALNSEAIVHLEASKGWDTAEGPLNATFHVEIPGSARTEDKRLLVRTVLFQLAGRQAFVQNERKTSVYLSYPYRVIDDIFIALPAGAQAESLPQIKPVTTDFAIYKQEVKLDGSLLEAHRDFAIVGFAFPVSVYPELKTFFATVQAGGQDPAVLRADGN